MFLATFFSLKQQIFIRSWPLGLAHATALPALLCSNKASPLLQFQLR